jgi:UDP-N-acetylglucosamine 2-epimerase (non-hydrolysing)
VIFPIHPRTAKNAESFGLMGLLDSLTTTDPLSYRVMLGLVEGAAVVLTDSGGLQEETTVLNVPCVTLREQTERPITLSEGTNRMAPWPLTQSGIVRSWGAARAARGERRGPPPGWDGRAAERIVQALRTHLPGNEAVSSALRVRAVPKNRASQYDGRSPAALDTRERDQTQVQ